MSKTNLSNEQVIQQVHKLSPQYLQFVKLLQIPESLIQQRIDKELEDNPALDVDKDDENITLPTFEDYNRYATFKTTSREYKDWKENSLTLEESFGNYLENQLPNLKLEGVDNVIADYIIGSLNNDGYFVLDYEIAINDIDLYFGEKVTVDDLKRILKILKTSLEPAGVCAQNLQECMLLQLQRLVDKDSIHRIALEVVKTYFDDFSKKKYELVKKKMELSEDDFEKVKEVITSLNPIPSNLEKYNTKIQHLAPDFIVTIDEDNHFNVELAYYNYPSLKVNKKYEKMLNSKDVSMEFLVYMKNNITSAIQFIKAIQKRKETLLSTIEIIVEKQRNFFLTGDKSTLVPMQLKTIAEEVNVDISTISRIVNSKSVQTFFGVFLLKVLFSEGIPGEGGESVSNIVVRDVLKEVIDKEDKKKPYSDIQLVKILTERGYKIARRTVTKYRESLNIPVARLRKN